MATGVDVLIGGKLVKGVSSYSVEEESTPIDIADTTGATGRFSISFFSNLAVAVKRMRRKTVDLEDKGQGTTQGIARVPASANGTITLSADSRLTLLVVQRTAQPFDGTLGAYFVYLLGLVGITDHYVVDSSLNAIPVTFPGWQGDVWLYMKKLLAAVGAEVSLVSDNIVFRPLRGRITVDKRDIEYSWSVDDTGLALSVEGYYYQNVARTNYLAYPPGGWNEDVSVYQVDANETITFDIPISSSLSSIAQPVAQDSVGRYSSSASVYCVMGNDGLPITAAQWTAAGGKITVEIGEDTRSLVVKIVGADLEEYAPFRIADTAGTSDNYSSLRIIGSGTFFDKVLVSVPTAVDPDLASDEVGATIDNEFISTQAELFDALIWSLARFGGSRQTITVKTSGINRAGDSGSYAYPTIADFNAAETALGHTTIAAFNAYALLQGWSDIGEFNEYEFASVSNAFVNQAFGNVAGARTKRDNVWWRIRRATLTPADITYTAEADTTVGDFNAEWPMTFNRFANPNYELAQLPINNASMSTFTIETVNGVNYGSGVTTSAASASMSIQPYANRTLVTPGQQTWLKIRVRNGAAGTRDFAVLLRYYDSSGAVAGTVISNVTSADYSIAAGQYLDFTLDASPVPVGAVSVGVVVIRRSTGGAQIGDVVQVGGVFLGRTEPKARISDFNAQWAGLTIADFNVAPLERAA